MGVDNLKIGFGFSFSLRIDNEPLFGHCQVEEPGWLMYPARTVLIKIPWDGTADEVE